MSNLSVDRDSLGLISRARGEFIHSLTQDGPLSLHSMVVDRGKSGEHAELVASNADVSQKTSRDVARLVAETLHAPIKEKGPGQTSGKMFEGAVAEFLAKTISNMNSVLPGVWRIENVGGNRSGDHISKYHPYRHIDELALAAQRDRSLLAVLGNSYVISPDILVLRKSETDESLNRQGIVVDNLSALLAPLRRSNSDPEGIHGPSEFVHAVVSCKWTMRSDRAQNSRSEALNLIRNRKGRTPHIVAVTAEPSMSRIASLALGTGDIDMVYHAFLPELRSAVGEIGNDEAIEMFDILVSGNRLRDISDLPLDMAL